MKLTKKYKSKKHKKKFIGGRDKHPIQISGTTYARPDMKSFSTNHPNIIKDMKISCNGVKDQDTLLDKLSKYPYFQITQPMNLVLFPYCNEEIKQRKFVSEKFADKVDLVNKPLLDPVSMNAFETAFGPNFSFNKTNVRQQNGSVISDPTSANNFIIFLKKYIQENSRKKGIFIVSHSGFMTNLMMELLKMEQQYNGENFGAPDLYTDIHQHNYNIAFDNLDIIHIQYDTKNKLFLNITIRRHRYQYNIDPGRQQTDANEPIETNITKQEIASEDDCPIINIFIMRHCLACHNLSSSLIEKASQYMFDTKGYLNYSLCLRKTCFDLLKVKNNLLDLFRTYCFFNKSPIRLSEIVFGSSVIFRAILTCSLVFNSLTRPESTEEEIEQLRLTSKELAPKSAMQTLGSNLSKVTDKIIGKTTTRHTKATAAIADDSDDDSDDDTDDDTDDDSNSIPPQPRSPKTPPSLPLATKSGPKFPAPEQQAPPMALSEKQRGKLPVSTTQPPSLSSASPRPLTSSQTDKQFEKKKSMENRRPNFYGNPTKQYKYYPQNPH